MWERAQELAQSNEQLRGACPGHASIKLSRWLYTYKLSGNSVQSAFNGTVVNSGCNTEFKIALKKTGGNWTIDRVILSN